MSCLPKPNSKDNHFILYITTKYNFYSVSSVSVTKHYRKKFLFANMGFNDKTLINWVKLGIIKFLDKFQHLIFLI